jgi:hypothetical protein
MASIINENITSNITDNECIVSVVTKSLPSKSWTTKMQSGENYCLEYSDDAIDDKLLVAFNKLVRGQTDVSNLVSDIIKSSNDEFILSRITNVFVLCFLTRSCRGGKGEKELFYQFFTYLSSVMPNSIKLVCKLIAHFGYWKDCFVLMAKYKLDKTIVNEILSVIINQLTNDFDKVIKAQVLGTSVSDIHISLLAKWLPRENKELYNLISSNFHNNYGMKSLIGEIINRLPPTIKRRLNGKNNNQKYRMLIKTLSMYIPIVEQNMCEKSFASIDFGIVPSIAIDKYKHAFAMEYVSPFAKSERNKYRVNVQSTERNVEPIDYEDRMQCKEHFKTHLLDNTKKVNGSQVAIEQLVNSIFASSCSDCDSLENFIDMGKTNLVLAHRQFESYVDYVNSQLEKTSEEISHANSDQPFTFDINNIKCMTDVSGSMSGTPMHVAIGLTLVFLRLQKLKNPNARQTFVTFDTNPTMVSLNGLNTFPRMVEVTRFAPWGGSTDFVKAFDEIMLEAGKNIANAPKQLLVFSDMQFNSSLGHTYTSYSYGSYGISTKQAVDRWETMYETICRKWKAWFGLTDEQCSTMMPTIVFWNLRSNTTGSPVDCTTKGVIQISGYSASLLKMLLYGEKLKQINNEKPDPSQVLSRTLRSIEYNCVREALGWVDNKINLESIFATEVFQLNALRLPTNDVKNYLNHDQYIDM